MELAVDPLDTVFLAAWFDGGDESGFVLHGLYGAAISLVSIFGLVCMARGLAGARRFVDAVSGRALGIVLIAVVVVASVLSLAWFLGVADMAPMLIPINLVSFVLAKVSTLAWSYLFVIALGGWLAGEQPRIGWPLAAVAASIDVVILLLFAVGGIMNLSEAGPIVNLIIGWLSIANWVLLLLAFATGLPSTAPVPREPEAPPTADRPAATRSGSGAG
jgi:hypothetical protein